MRQFHHGPQRHLPEVRHLRRDDGVQLSRPLFDGGSDGDIVTNGFAYNEAARAANVSFGHFHYATDEIILPSNKKS